METLISSKAPEGFMCRRLASGDFSKGFSQLLENLTTVGDLNEEKFEEIIEKLNQRPEEYIIIVFVDPENQKLVAHGTILIEQKLIHSGSKVGHIEDIVVSKDLRGRGIGKQLVTSLVDIGRFLGCYKVILDCKDELIPFYESCGLQTRCTHMGIYFENN